MRPPRPQPQVPTRSSWRAATAHSPALPRRRLAPESGSRSSRPGPRTTSRASLKSRSSSARHAASQPKGISVRRLDVGRMGDRPFLNVASTGLPPAAAEHADGLKEKLGPLAYAVGAARAGLEEDPVDCTVRCDDSEIHTGAVWQVTVACSGAFGGGSSIETELSDSKLDVVVIEAGSRLKLAQHAYGMRRGGIGEQEGVTKVRCSDSGGGAGGRGRPGTWTASWSSLAPRSSGSIPTRSR